MQCIIVQNTMQIQINLYLRDGQKNSYSSYQDLHIFHSVEELESCIGETFAVQEGILALATIFQRWNILPREEEGISFEPKRVGGFTKPKYPINVIVKSRK